MASIVEDFLTAQEEQEVIQAIRQAESQTSGEIRVHLERHSDLSPMERATALFHLLKMDNTKAENGVLIYVAVEDHQLAVIGDRGINTRVPDDFWEGTRDAMITAFKAGQFKQGLIKGVRSVGEKLQRYFPWDQDDKNELPDEISTS